MTDVRSPDIGSPPQRSPVNRGKTITETCSAISPIVQDTNMDQPSPLLPSSTAPASSTALTGAEMRDKQLRELLRMRGMYGVSSSSSSGATQRTNMFTGQPDKNIFMEEDDDGKTQKLIAEAR